MNSSRNKKPGEQLEDISGTRNRVPEGHEIKVPGFAIVGHPNKGKSSIVATLAEDEGVAISRFPGTTRRAMFYAMRLDGEVQYQLIDTPGFQRPREVLEWLQQDSPSAQQRNQRVCEFVREHQQDPRFHDEVALLQPILEGAGILYVVDGARPYGPEYEAEMEILRWTGQPRMALINPMGSDAHVAEWKRALDQYFSLVRVFDPLRADFTKRIELLKSFAGLNDAWRNSLERAVVALENEHVQRQHQVAREIGMLLQDVLSAQESKLMTTEPESALEQQLLRKLQGRIRQRERSAWSVIRDLYHHRNLDTTTAAELSLGNLGTDLFSKRTFTLFGLSGFQLLMTGAASGAMAGGSIDLLTGGASLLLGAGIGALVGSAGVFFGARQLAEVDVLGMPLGGYRLTVGPISDPNFPWVVLGRALLYFQLIAERNHARREALVVSVEAEGHLADELPVLQRKKLLRLFEGLRKNLALVPAEENELTALLDDLLGASLGSVPEQSLE